MDALLVFWLALLDEAVILQPLHPFPAGRGGEADALAEFGDGQGGVLLQEAQDLAVDRVYHSTNIHYYRKLFYSRVIWQQNR